MTIQPGPFAAPEGSTEKTYQVTITTVVPMTHTDPADLDFEALLETIRDQAHGADVQSVEMVATEPEPTSKGWEVADQVMDDPAGFRALCERLVADNRARAEPKPKPEPEPRTRYTGKLKASVVFTRNDKSVTDGLMADCLYLAHGGKGFADASCPELQRLLFDFGSDYTAGWGASKAEIHISNWKHESICGWVPRGIDGGVEVNPVLHYDTKYKVCLKCRKAVEAMTPGGAA